MYLYFNLICQVIGNCILWILNLGTKSFDEVIKKDNYWIGYIFIIIVVFAFYSKT